MFRKAAPVPAPTATATPGKEGKATAPAPNKGASPAGSKPSAAPKVDVIANCSKRHEAFGKVLKDLVDALKKRQHTLGANRKAEQEVVRQFTALIKDTPLATGKKSYASVHDALAKAMLKEEDLFVSKVIDYATEWSKLVELTFTAEIKEARKARKDLEHYRKKVGNLRIDKERKTAKDKELAPKEAEKLDRNEDKLATAERNVKKHEKNLHNLMEELIDRSWKDVYPLLVELLQFDMTTSDSKAKSLAGLQDVLDSLAAVAKEHNLQAAGRSAAELWRKRQASLPKIDKEDLKKDDSSDEGTGSDKEGE